MGCIAGMMTGTDLLLQEGDSWKINKMFHILCIECSKGVKEESRENWHRSAGVCAWM